MRGLFLRRIYPEPTPKEVTINVTGTGDSTYCYVTINGTKVYSAGSYIVETGSKILCYVNHQRYGAPLEIAVNGVIKISGSDKIAKTYTHKATKSASIVLSYRYSVLSAASTSNYSKIAITEE